MRPPVVPRWARSEFLRELGDLRRLDCGWPRRGVVRRRCGFCMACEADSFAGLGADRVLH